jgi:hypothetical protein
MKCCAEGERKMAEFDEITCGHLTARGDKATGAPAANFGSHVGVEGNIDVLGGLVVEKVIGARANLEVGGHLSASGNKATGAPAANFGSHVGVEGNIDVTGRVNAVEFRVVGADCAENFDISDCAEDISEGSVMVLTDDGRLKPSSLPYDPRAIGVVSGAGAYRPGIILDTDGDAARRCAPIGLIGKVYCKADASTAAIEIGDLLTTSAVPGHAMKAADPTQSFGAIVGKALGSLSEGCGLIPMLVARQ